MNAIQNSIIENNNCQYNIIGKYTFELFKKDNTDLPLNEIDKEINELSK